MFKRINPLSKTFIEGMAYQIKYLVKEKRISDKALIWHLRNILSDKGILVEPVETPKPWEWSEKI